MKVCYLVFHCGNTKKLQCSVEANQLGARNGICHCSKHQTYSMIQHLNLFLGSPSLPWAGGLWAFCRLPAHTPWKCSRLVGSSHRPLQQTLTTKILSQGCIGSSSERSVTLCNVPTHCFFPIIAVVDCWQ